MRAASARVVLAGGPARLVTTCRARRAGVAAASASAATAAASFRSRSAPAAVAAAVSAAPVSGSSAAAASMSGLSPDVRAAVMAALAAGREDAAASSSSSASAAAAASKPQPKARAKAAAAAAGGASGASAAAPRPAGAAAAASAGGGGAGARRGMVTQGGLDKIVKLDAFRQESSERVAELWVEFHRKKACLSGVIPEETYTKMRTRADKAPMFVLPLPRGEGFQSWIWVHQGEHALVTSLEEYRTMGANAPAHVNIAYYEELKEEKGIVLMRSQEIDTRHISLQEAQYLANAWQLFVLDDERYKLVYDFNHKPADFDFNKVVQLMDTVPDCKTS